MGWEGCSWGGISTSVISASFASSTLLEVTPYENPDLPNKEGSDYSLCSIIYYSVT